MKHLENRSMLSWVCLLLASLALIMAGGLLLSGCGASDLAEYQAVVDEVNEEYHQQFTVNLSENPEITPEQLRAHLESVARGEQHPEQIPLQPANAL